MGEFIMSDGVDWKDVENGIQEELDGRVFNRVPTEVSILLSDKLQAIVGADSGSQPSEG
ncbi:hypothetical protein BrE312_2182 [Brenneria sp. EniD312]|nr:hypothetical protein BrE312_2182 [Brenneria sp. EniD312]